MRKLLLGKNCNMLDTRSGYFFYMLTNISRSYLGFPHLLRWLFPLNLTRLFCCFLLLLPGQLELNLCKLPKPAKNARNCGLDQIEYSKHNIEIVSLFDLKRINGWWPATGTKDGEQILAVSEIVVSAHAGCAIRLSQVQTNNYGLFLLRYVSVRRTY